MQVTDAQEHVTPIPSPTDPFAPLSQDVSGLLYKFLSVRDLVSLSTVSHFLYENVAHQQHWFDLCARRWPSLRASLEASSSSPQSGNTALTHAPFFPSTRAYINAGDVINKTCFRSTFLQHAEAEMNWRRTRPVHVTQERLVFRHTDTGGIQSEPVTSITLSKTGGRELMSIAMGRHVGVFRADASGEISVHEGPQLLIDVLNKGRTNTKNRIINSTKISSSKLVATGNDHSLRMIDLATGSQHTFMEQHTDSVWGLSLDRGSSTNWDEDVLGVYTTSDNAIDNNNSSSGSSSVGGDGGNLMVASSSYGLIAIFDADRGWKPAIRFQGHSSSWIRTLHLDINRHLLISGSADSTCKAWDLRRAGEVLMRYVHPNHFEEIRGVECVGNRLFTGCYDGMVREYELDSGCLKGVVANHGVYAVECLSLSRDTGRMVSVDWDGVLAVRKGRPLIDLEPEAAKEDTSVLCFGERFEEGWMEETGLGSSLSSFVSEGCGNNSYLRPDYGCEALRGPGRRITCDVLGPALDRKEDLESSLNAKVICMQHNQERLVMGTKSGDVISLLFRKGLSGEV